MTSLNLTNFKTGIFNDIYMVENTGRTSIYNMFGSKTDVSNLGGISTTTLTQIVNTITAISTLNSALSDEVSTLTFNNYMVNTNNALTLKAPLLNASFTGTMGLNLSNTDTLDSALFIKGVRNDYPTTEGIRFGYSNNILLRLPNM